MARDNKLNLNNTSEEEEDESECNYEAGMGNIGVTNIMETKVEISPYENSRNINEINNYNDKDNGNNNLDDYGINDELETYCTPVKKKNSIYYA